MRIVWIVIALVVTGAGAYLFWGKSRSESGSGEGPENSNAASNDAAILAVEPTLGAVEAPPNRKLSPPAAASERSEEGDLRSEIAKQPGEVGDPSRLRLGEVLLGSEDSKDRAEGQRLLGEVYARGGALAAEAATQLLRSSSEQEARIKYATFIVERGPASSGYSESARLLARTRLASPGETDKARAWQLLSQAYFSTHDAPLRAELRAELDPLVAELIFSPRPSNACTTYTVVKGDSLARIAKAHHTSVDLIRYLNALKTDMIHPGNRLKVLTGKITVEVDKSEYRLDTRIDGNYLFSAAVGLGVEGRTPTGTFVVEIMQEKPDWQKPGQKVIPYGHSENPLGERWIGFKNTVEHSGYGIHGTDQPASIGTDSSQGCIRLRNEDVMFLYRFVTGGTSVSVRD